jgi:protein TonB
MITGERDIAQLASNGLALLVAFALAAVWWSVQPNLWRDAKPPEVMASDASIEVSVQQDLPPVASPAQPEPVALQQELHRVATRRVAAPAPAEVQPPTASPEAVPDGGAVVASASPPPRSMPSSAPRPDLEAQYAMGLHADIDRRTHPPDSAQYRLRRPSGEVRVGFVLIRSGRIKLVRVLRTSGSTLLDDAAVAIVSTGQYPPMSADLFAGEAEHMFSVTIEFRRTG